MASEQITQMRLAIHEAETNLHATLPPLDPNLEEFDAFAPNSDNELTIPLKIIRPKQTPSNTTNPTDPPKPLILLFHGGGFATGTNTQLLRPGREFAFSFNAVVILASYRKAPENPFPTPMLDGWSVADHVSRPENAFGADPAHGFIVGGFSAGAQIAAVIPRQSKEKPLASPVTGLYLGIPSMLAEEIVPARYRDVWTSMVENSTAELNSDMAKLILDTLGADVKSPWFSPVNSPLGLGGMPRTYVQVGGRDVWRDDGVVFAKVLEEAGVDVKLDRFEGMSHGSFTVWAQGEGGHNPVDLKPRMMRGMAGMLGREG